MIDIHAHILPGLDDGARDISDTLEMAELAVSSGVKAIVATPHCNVPGMFRNFFANEYIRIYESAVRVLREEGIPLELYPGMEVFGTYDLPDLLVEKKIMPINQSRYVLIEFGFDEDPDFMTNVLRRVRDVGAKPVVAHVERYEAIQDNPEIIYKWRRSGYQIQVNKGSFMGRFGVKAEKVSYRLLNHDMITVIASDAHGSTRRTPYMMDAYAELSTLYPQEKLRRLFSENPRRICSNRPIF